MSFTVAHIFGLGSVELFHLDLSCRFGLRMDEIDRDLQSIQTLM